MLTDAEKADRKRHRMIEKSREYTTPTYVRQFVAPVFQRMIRAEAGAQPAGLTTAISRGSARQFHRRVGECVCVTCGTVTPWTTHQGAMQTGHFIHHVAAVRFLSDNVAPQCVWCNKHRGGAAEDYRLWMETVRGVETIERLTRLKGTKVRFTCEELVDMRIED